MTAHGSPPLVTRPPSRQQSALARLVASGCAAALAGGLVAGNADALISRDTPAASAVQQTPPKGPPPVRLSDYSLTLALHPYTSCWSSGSSGLCYDGMPPRPVPSMGGVSGPVTLAFGEDGWRFHVTVKDRKGDSSRVRLVKISPHHWRLALRPLADGRYRADVFGRGPEGDVAAAFAFTLN